MRVAALCDIHGNLPALEAVLADLEGERVDAVVCGGDVVSGPYPAETLAALESVGALFLGGNTEREVLAGQEGLARWSAERLGPEGLSEVARWPATVELEVDGLGAVVFCHATPRSDDELMTPLTPAADVVGMLDGHDTVVCGHVHVRYDRRLPGGQRVVNPGSVGMPYEGERGAYWALIGPDVEFRRSTYDVEAAYATFRELDVPAREELFAALLDPPGPDETLAFFESHRGA